MNPLVMAGKYVLKKAFKETAYRLCDGMSPRKLFIFRLQKAVEIYEQEQKITDEILIILIGDRYNSALEQIADDAGVTSLVHTILNQKNKGNDFFESRVYRFLQQYHFNTEEMGESLSKQELDDFFDQTRLLIKSLTK